MEAVCFDTTSKSAYPEWLVERLGKMVETTAPGDEYPAGQRGLLLSVATKNRWGGRGVYCTVAFNLADIGDETNVELSHIQPVWWRAPK